MKVLCIILIPCIIVFTFGASCSYIGLFDRLLTYFEYVTENVTPPSLLGGYDYTSGFKEGAFASAYLLTLPVRMLWCFMQIIFYSCSYWSVTI